MSANWSSTTVLTECRYSMMLRLPCCIMVSSSLSCITRVLDLLAWSFVSFVQAWCDVWKLRWGEFMPEKLSYSREAATQIEHATWREVSWREMCSDLLGSFDGYWSAVREGSGNGGSNKVIVNTRWSLRGFSLVYHIENLITIIVNFTGAAIPAGNQQGKLLSLAFKM